MTQNYGFINHRGYDRNIVRYLGKMAVGLPLVLDPDFVPLLLGDLKDLLQESPHVQQLTSSKLDLDNSFTCTDSIISKSNVTMLPTDMR